MTTERIARRAAAPAWIALCAAAFSFRAAEARTWVVEADGSGDAPTIQAAIDSSSNGDLILVGPGKYAEHLDTRGRSVRLTGVAGPEATIVTGSGSGSVYTADSFETPSTVIQGFTFRDGAGTHLLAPRDVGPPPGGGADPFRQETYGGGILLLSASPTVRDCILEDSFANNGGGIFATNCFTTLEDVIIRGNTAGTGAAAALEDGRLNFVNVTLEDNFAVFAAGLWIRFNAEATFTDCRFLDNSAAEFGLFRILQADVALDRCLVTGTVAGEATFGAVQGGGLTVIRSTLARNGAPIDPSLFRVESGGALHLDRSILAFNRAEALFTCVGGEVSMECCDVYDPPAPLPECAVLSQNIDADPLFCDLAARDFGLQPGSPCAAGNGLPECGGIGAFGVGCATSGAPEAGGVEPMSWGRIKSAFR